MFISFLDSVNRDLCRAVQCLCSAVQSCAEPCAVLLKSLLTLSKSEIEHLKSIAPGSSRVWGEIHENFQSRAVKKRGVSVRSTAQGSAQLCTGLCTEVEKWGFDHSKDRSDQYFGLF